MPSRPAREPVAALPPPSFADLPNDVPGGRRGVVRIIAADLDAVTFFEELSPGTDIDALLAIVSLVSLALLDLIGDPSRVPDHDRAYGAGAGWVMPSFTRRGRASRFSDGRFGAWYVAWDATTAVAETIYHTTLRLQETREPPQEVALQVLTADVAGFAAVLTGLGGSLGSAVHHPNSYVVSQLAGRHLLDRGSEAIVYRSVRQPGGTCAGILRPRAVRHCRRTGLIRYTWDTAVLTAGPVHPL